MSRPEYDALYETIVAIPDDAVVTPNMPVSTYLQEGENLQHWCQADLEKLVGAGLDKSLVETLLQRLGALREAQSNWITTRFTKEEAAKQWQVLSPVAYDLRNQLLHHYRFAFRLHADLLKRIDAIDEGQGGADMLQDLNDLSVLGREHMALLEAIGFDLSLLEKAAKTSDDLATLWAVAHGESADNVEAKSIRDKAYTYVKQAVDEIRECGRYVFWRDEDRAKGYASEYLRRYRRKQDVEDEKFL